MSRTVVYKQAKILTLIEACKGSIVRRQRWCICSVALGKQGVVPGVRREVDAGVGPGERPCLGPGVGPGVGRGVGSWDGFGENSHGSGVGSGDGLGEGQGPSVGPGVMPGLGHGVGPGEVHGLGLGVGHGVGPRVGSGLGPAVGAGVGRGSAWCRARVKEAGASKQTSAFLIRLMSIGEEVKDVIWTIEFAVIVWW